MLGIEDDVIGPEGKTALVASWLKELGLGELVEIKSYRGKMLVKSKIDLHSSPQWTEVVARYRERFGERESLVVLAHRNPELNIRAISYGKNPYLVMADGQKYMLGATLKSGYTVSRIRSDSVELTRAGKSVEYRLENK